MYFSDSHLQPFCDFILDCNAYLWFITKYNLSFQLEMPPRGTMTPPNYLPSDFRRRDNIKAGFEELQRIVPHTGRLDGEKLSQASNGVVIT